MQIHLSCMVLISYVTAYICESFPRKPIRFPMTGKRIRKIPLWIDNTLYFFGIYIINVYQNNSGVDGFFLNCFSVGKI